MIEIAEQIWDWIFHDPVISTIIFIFAVTITLTLYGAKRVEEN